MIRSVILPVRIGPYTFRETIGEGGFSVVKLVKRDDTHEDFVCKIVPKTRLLRGNLEPQLEMEIRINQQIDHPGVVSVIDILKDHFNYYIIMEYCSAGDLFNYIVSRGHIEEEEAKPILYQILETIQFLHKMRVTHRDLKPENILINSEGHIKLSDFGLSRFLGSDHLAHTPCGSPYYASPECMSGLPYNGLVSDMWSVGVILFAMLTGNIPWTKRNVAGLMEQIRKGAYTIPESVSPEARSLISGLMEVDPMKRLGIEAALRHPWLKDIVIKPMSTVTAAPRLSLKRLDKFFDKEYDFESDGVCVLPRTTTELDMDYNKTVRGITKLPARLARRPKAASDAEVHIAVSTVGAPK